jgi:hypothetical protein
VEDLDPSPHAARIRFSIPQGQPGPPGPDTLAGLTDVEDTAATAPVGSLLGVIGVAGRWGYVPRSVRTSRPNGDDRLVEVWTGSEWVTVHYDSGARNITDLLTNGWKATNVTLRRNLSRVWLNIHGLDGTASTGMTLLPMLATGFRPGVEVVGLVGRSGNSLPNMLISAGYGGGVWQNTGRDTISQGIVQLDWAPYDPIPTSLPGT